MTYCSVYINSCKDMSYCSGQYALYVRHNDNLVKLGLTSLQNIERGRVGIAGNSALCYVESVNWQALTVSAAGTDIDDNKNQAECGM